jgi:hypothetical protein
MSPDTAFGIMEGMIGTQIDADCFLALKRAIAGIEPAMHDARAVA